MRSPEGTWEPQTGPGGIIRIASESGASRIHDKTHAGRREGTNLVLDPIEAAWLATEGRLRLVGTDVAALLGAHTTETAYLVYCDLRARGLTVRWDASSRAILVWERGGHPPTKPASRIVPCNEQDVVTAGTLAAWAQHGFAAGVVDEDATVTYYQLAASDPQGDVPIQLRTPLAGRALADHVLVQDIAPHDQESIGTPHPAGLLLSAVEAAHLARRGLLETPLPTTPRLAVQAPVYEDLRRRGVVPRSGLRFGSDLRAYRGRPGDGHADWLVQCAAPDDPLAWSSLSRGIRLAHSVRKQFLVALAQDTVAYVHLAWFRP